MSLPFDLHIIFVPDTGLIVVREGLHIDTVGMTNRDIVGGIMEYLMRRLPEDHTAENLRSALQMVLDYVPILPGHLDERPDAE